MSNRTTANDVPANVGLIEVRVRELRQLFNSIDPSPFQERDLDANAEKFIVEWAMEFPRSSSLTLVVHVDQPIAAQDDHLLRDAMHQYFQRQAQATRRQLRDLFRRGRISLLIALLFFAALGVIANLLDRLLHDTVAGLLREGLLIGGWVAMWRPIEVFLYDWWPIRARARLYERLAAMPVRILS